MPRNKFETKIYNSLIRKIGKRRFKYESEKIAYVIASHYVPDFIIDTPTGKIYLETKGYFRPEDKRKLVAVKKCNPQIDLRIVFYSHNKQYVRWAERHGIRWAVEKIPKEWLDGL